jgi:ElaB/YqjD/DUF883 family membrane-anchored ribosome-binding protein
MSSIQTEAPASDGSTSMAAQAQEKVQQTAQQAGSTAARYVREQTESRGRQIATELESVAHALRRSSHALHADGNSTAARGIEQVTERLESLGGYLGSTGGDKMLRDLETFGRRKPWGMIGLGMGLGMAASRFLKASSSRRYEPQSQSQMRMQPQPTRVPIAADQHVTGEIPVTHTRSV